MATSDAQKRANYKWARKNTHISTVKMANWEYALFKSACAAAGVTPHSVFLAAAREFISTHPGGGTPAAGLSTDTPGTDSSGVPDALPERGAAYTSSGGAGPDASAAGPVAD